MGTDIDFQYIETLLRCKVSEILYFLVDKSKICSRKGLIRGEKVRVGTSNV